MISSWIMCRIKSGRIIWGKYLKEYGIDDGLVLDLGCGTGSMTEMLASSGYDMIGVDNAEEMLEIAMEKKVESGHDILYLLQDMREFELIRNGQSSYKCLRFCELYYWTMRT